ncbi:hypothetical protein SAMN05518865_13025 [Duganella sp. CF458]|uniref:hypothetical protein n=1 Tax=Duganella sp. CF458 TaxID=1884368 RepID=UPI0008F099FB|nr:hypothetical protein [Duganella sp. CF458]SFH01635.1 hypothetical protein SAMN05518865_13025 [Duganella sp. CF458]
MQFNLENVKALVSQAYISHAQIAFGERGKDCVVLLLDKLRLIYQRCPPERISTTFTLLVGVVADPFAPLIQEIGKTLHHQNTVAEVGDFLIKAFASQKNTTVEICADGTFRTMEHNVDPELSTLWNRCVMYQFKKGREQIRSDDHNAYIPKISPVLVSNFAVPTLSGLDAALTRYQEIALNSECRILAGIWEGSVDGPRLVMVNKPESQMRDSLIQALQLLTHDTSVRPEQNTDETKPVDIRIDWFASGASALIEVKWLGRSTAIPREPKKGPTFTDYYPARAQDGANQLADYMDREVRHSNASSPRGYLVVFDARRRNVKGAADKLSKTDATYFENDELLFVPDHSKTREDFAPPRRFFLKPRESCFA